MVEEISGNGDGYGSSSGSGYGNGDGYGYGSGSGYGYGSGYDYGSGYGYGYGYGYGSGDGNGYGNGNGYAVKAKQVITVTAAHLRRAKACEDQVLKFQTLFPTGATWPGDIEKAKQAGLDVEWARANLGLFYPEGKP